MAVSNFGCYYITAGSSYNYHHDCVTIFRDVTLVSPTAGLDAVVLSQLDSMLFVAGNHGNVYSVKLPLLEKAEYLEFTMHKRQILMVNRKQ